MTNGVEGFSPLELLFRRRASRREGSLIADGREVPASQILGAARRVAARLFDDGVQVGDFVFLSMHNSAEYLAAALGVSFTGAVMVPINTSFTVAEIRYLFDVAPARAWISDAGLAQTMREAELPNAVDLRYIVDADLDHPLKAMNDWANPPLDSPIREIWPDAPAAVFFTAGTTGRPKGALTSHAALAAFVDVVADATAMSALDTVVLPMPMFYTGGLKASLANVLAGARVVIFRKWSPPDLIDALDEYCGTFLWAVTSVWALAIRAANFDEEKVQSVRAVWRAGAHTPQSLLEDMLRIWPDRPHYHSYGLTECNLATMERDAINHPDSCGFANLGVQLSIEGERVPEQLGEIWLRGPQQFSGYIGDPETTGRILSGGWVHTGDAGWLEPDGRLHVMGRGSEIIIRGGENISAAEVERVLLGVPSVAEAAVIGVPDDVFGHEVKAIVVPASGSHLDLDALRAECLKVLAEFKVPRIYEIRTEPLPKNPAGKIIKARL
jgi:long-chain acyl-CoA synthetase